ncbi:hypothetical protein JHN52_24355 [Streptomyces sp. MBT97]|uniref:hypothetical protein n=1 Tax=Streptomyces sp. MBT97 TaxID=2800411 RepID=UPI00190CAB8A|nr:hypothetical protein [Streptomyces sp. MBT97]MBK3636001.1 hypothetical protein [Streptomyces sp. MBT97]
MHLRKALTVSATVVALAAAGACGSSQDSGDAAATPASAASAGGTPSAGAADPGTAGGLPQASDMASVAGYLNEYTPCQDVATGDEYDAQNDGEAWGTDEAQDPAWGIEERAVCTDGSGRPIALLIAPDMKKFQTAAKSSGDKFLVGEDFAVVPVGDEAIRSLQPSGLRFLTCEADLALPSGFEKEPALVDGCVLTNYVPE